MEITRTTDILVETKRRFIIRQRATGAAILCPVCGERMLAAEMAAAFFQIKCRRVYQLVEAGAAHFVEIEAGATFVCPPSLDAAIKNEIAVPPIEIAGLVVDAATENPIGEIES